MKRNKPAGRSRSTMIARGATTRRATTKRGQTTILLYEVHCRETHSVIRCRTFAAIVMIIIGSPHPSMITGPRDPSPRGKQLLYAMKIALRLPRLTPFRLICNEGGLVRRSTISARRCLSTGTENIKTTRSKSQELALDSLAMQQHFTKHIQHRLFDLSMH
jgi:hypothetical protein